jgi:predicted nucleic acid-binding protein
MKIKPPIIVDCTVLSNFAHLQRLDILYQLYPKDIIVPTNVIAEIIKKPTLELPY